MSLSNIRELLIIIAVYLYFMSWVYLHYYYDSFGISLNSLKIDYASYIAYSYLVISSGLFLAFAGMAAAVAGILALVVKRILSKSQPGKREKIQAGLVRSRWSVVGIIMTLLFPIGFFIAEHVARGNAATDRSYTGDRPVIQFTFRNSFGEGQPIHTDSLLLLSTDRKYDLNLLRSDTLQTLRLLGESDSYYIVLRQPRINPAIGILPSGSVYYIAKSDILLTKIILP